MEITTDERFLSCLEYLAQKFAGHIQKTADRYLLKLSEKQIDQDALSDAIVHQIVTTMKAKYLQDKIKIKRTTLIKVLINYDNKTDTILANALFEVTPVMLLDALYDFGINKLKSRWDEVIQLVNENYLQLSQKPLYNELLRFLILNMDYHTAEAHIMAINHQPTICNSDLEPLPQTDESLINTLVEIAPKQIFIHADKDLATDVINEIEQLFPNCVCIEYNAVL